MTTAAVIDASVLAMRFGITKAAARRWLRDDLPHVRRGRSRFTTESWLTQWMAENVKRPPKVCGTSPLDDLVKSLASQLIGELVRQGKLQIIYPTEKEVA